MHDQQPDQVLEKYARKRPWSHFAALVIILLLVISAFLAAEWDFTSLTNGERRAQAFRRMWSWAGAFASPDFSLGFLRHGWALTLQTLSTATMGTFLAVVLAFILAMGSSRAIAAGGGQEGWRWRSFPFPGPAILFCSSCRLLQDILRSVPDFVWAIILVAVLGLGPLTGALALTLNITGILAKVYSELWDNVSEREYEQVRSLGAGRLAVFLYGIRPLAARGVQSFTLMRAECAIRNAAVIGVVGGGGLGADIWYQIQFGAWGKVSTLILFTLALTLTADLASNFIRRQLRTDPNHPRAHKPQSPLRSLARGYVGAAFVLAVVMWSFYFMAWGDNAPPGQQSRNHLEPAVKLFTGASWKNLQFFERLLKPELDLVSIGFGDPEEVAKAEAAGKTVALFADHGPWYFWHPAAWQAWNEELSKWFVWRVIQSSSVPLAMGIIGTLTGMLGAILLTYPHSLAFMLESSRFTGESPRAWLRAARIAQMALARSVGLIFRGAPEVMWAFLFIAFFGPGLIAGTIALGLHTMGVLVRVFGETVDNIPYRRFEQSFTGSRVACFAYVAAPVSWRDWMTYSFFQFESNVRSAVVMGIVGAGGLGFYFTFNFEWFRFERAGTYLLMIIALTIVIDRISRLLKISRVTR